MDVNEFSQQLSAIAKSSPKVAIAAAVFENLISITEAVSKQVARIPKYKLPRIAQAARRRQRESICMMGLSMYFGAARQQMILSQPIPKSLPRNLPSDGIAVLGNSSQEEIFKLNPETSPLTPVAPNYLEPGR